MRLKQQKFTLIGIVAALTMAVADVILLGQPVSGSRYDLASFGAMEHIGALRASIGSLLGLVASFFICFGYYHLKLLFQPVHSRRAHILFVALCSTMFVGGAFHAGYYFLSPYVSGTLVHAAQQKFIYHLIIISALAAPGLMAGNILFVMLATDSRFPRWFKFCNPMALNALYLGVFYALPAPVGGYLKPTFINLATATVFALSWVAEKRSLSYAATGVANS